MFNKLASAAFAAALALAMLAPSANAQKALVYCPVGVDAAGCDRVVAALQSKFSDGVDRGYDGTAGTVDLNKADLNHYGVVVVPSLADNADKQPYAVLRSAAARLRLAINGRVAVYSGAPDQGSANRVDKDALIQNLALWASKGHTRGTSLVGLVAFLDLSDNESDRYAWVKDVSLVEVSADAELQAFPEVSTVSPRGSKLLSSGGKALRFANMASYGLHIGRGAAARTEVGAFGGASGAQSVLVTYANADGSDLDDSGSSTGKVGSSGASFNLSASNSASLSTSTSTAGATLTTDKADYQPGDIVTFSGSGWGANDTVTITIHEDPQWSHPDRTLTVVADGSGSFSDHTFVVDQRDYGLTFTATAVGNPSGFVAQTTFTDGNKITFSTTAAGNEVAAWGSVTAGACTEIWVQERQGSNFDNANPARVVTLTSSPAGVTFYNAASCSVGSTITSVTIAVNTSAAQFWFKTNATATIAGSAVGLTGSNNASTAVTVAGVVATTTALARTGGTPTVYGTAVTFTATVTGTTNPSGVGTVTFKNGASVLCSAVPLTGNTAQCIPANAVFGAGSYSVTAEYSGTASFGASVSSPAIAHVVTPKALTVTGITAASRPYNGTTSATLSFGSAALVGVISPDVVTLQTGAATGTFADKNVGVGKTVTIAGLTLSGAAASNYTLTQPTTTADITALGVTGSYTAANKVYNGNAIAALSVPIVTGAIAGDVVSLTGGTGAFANKNVGTNKPVAVTGATLTGADAPNYTLGAVTANNADITALGVTGSYTAANKVYNGNAVATLSVPVVTGAIVGDVVSLTGGIGAFADKNVGTSKPVTVTGATLAGVDAPNYTLGAVTANNADITALAVTGSYTAANKVYNGNAVAILSVPIVNGAIGTDVVSLTGGIGAFANKNVGTNKSVTVTGATLAGADAPNYTLGAVTANNADITALGVTGSYTAANKVYNGNAVATLSVPVVTGAIVGDVVSLTGGIGAFADKIVGTNKPVTVTGATLAGADAPNYTLGAVTANNADITALGITGSYTAANKVYNGNAVAVLSAPLLSGVLAGDGVNLTGGIGAFANKNVGANKTVTVTGATLAGADAPNYTLSAVTANNADISVLAVTGSYTAANKVYNADAVATLSLPMVNGAIGGDAVSLTGGTGAFANKTVGTNKPVTVTGAALSGADAPNYTLGAVTANNADITALGITGSYTAANKVYNGNAVAVLSAPLLSGVLAGDAVNLTGGTGAFANKNVGTNKTVTVTGATLAGADAPNYTLSAVTANNADITALAVTGSYTAANKVYNGNAIAILSVPVVNGAIGGDAVSLTGGIGAFADKNVGTNKPVTVTGTTLSGADAPNYALGAVTANNADITALAVTGSYTAANKVYNGNAVAALSAPIVTGAIAGDVVSLTGGTGAFGNKNVGTNKPVTVTGATLAGADAPNYALGAVTANNADITALAVTGSYTAANKVYNGNAIAVLSAPIVNGAIGGDAVSLTGGTGAFANKTVGTNKPVTVTGTTLSGADALNYALGAVTANNADITVLAVTGSYTAANKVYNADAVATLSLPMVNGAIGGDAVSLTGGTGAFANKTVGTNKPVTVTGATLAGADAPNYTLGAVTANNADITALGITGSYTAANKVYNGNTVAVLSAPLLSGVLAGDAVNLTGGTGAFANKNVGTNKTVTVTGATLAGADAPNYTLSAVTANNADISVLAVTGSYTAANKVYNADAVATLSLPMVNGAIGGDAVSLTGGTGAFANKTVGTNKPVTVTGAALSGADAPNYTLGAVTANNADITALGITGSYTAANKVYNGNAVAVLSAPLLSGVLAGDAVNLTGGTGAFANKNVGTNKTVTVTGATLAGADAPNYTLSAVTANNADITALAVTGSYTAANKVYNGNAIAILSVPVVNGAIGGDAVSLTGGIGAFADKNVGTNKPVTVTGTTLSGADAPNYALGAVTANNADITALAVTGSYTAANKVYNGNAVAALSAPIVTGAIAGDVVSLTGGTGAFGNKNVGTNKPVTVTGATLAGADAPNYALGAVTANNADITALAVTGSYTAANKVYNGNAIAVLSAPIVNGAIGGDAVSLTGGTGAFANKTVGTNKPVTVTGTTLSGADAPNYALGAVTANNADITVLAVTGSYTAANKVYNADAVATLSLPMVNGAIGGDAVSLTGGTGAFANKTVGTNKPVTVTGATLAGADAPNYALGAVTANNANITALGITGSYTAANKVYNGNTVAILSAPTLSGVLAEDIVNLTGGAGAFANKNVGTNKPVTVTGATLSGADAPNYTLGAVTANNADITVLAVTGSYTAANKVYNGDAVATLTVPLVNGAIGGDAVSLTSGIGAFNNKNVGTSKPVTVSGATLTGGDATNYTLGAVTANNANITPATPTVNWANPSNIVWPAPLTSTQLNATISGVLSEVPAGAFTYTPASGTVLTPGTQALSVTFASSDANYTNATGGASITVLDQAGPIVTLSLVNPNPAPLNATMTVTGKVSDATTGGSGISSACFKVDGGATCTPMTATGGTSFGQVTVNVTGSLAGYSTAGVHSVCVYGTDASGNVGVEKLGTDQYCVLVAVYDPSAGFVTGGGWIDSPQGAYIANPSLTGKATFGFVSKYKKGQSVPDGDTEFQFHAAGMNFKSTSYEWLVIAGAKAQYKGSGTINGSGDYFFMLTATDGDLKAKGTPDTFRMKIWNKTTLAVLYDNQIGLSDTGEPTMTLGGGSIQIHDK